MDQDSIKILLTIASVAIAFYFGTRTKERTERTDYAQERIQVAKIESEIKDISRDISNIQQNMQQMNRTSSDYHIRQERAEKDLEEIKNRLQRVESDINELRNMTNR